MNKIPRVAMAILYQQGRFLMQLRDDKPDILYPGHWGLFGGHLEPDETPEEGWRRELLEEIDYVPPNFTQFRCDVNPDIIRHFFHAYLTVSLDRLVLNEGWDLGLVSPEEVHRGRCYSEKAGETRPLGSPHQKILIDFLDSGLLPLHDLEG